MTLRQIAPVSASSLQTTPRSRVIEIKYSTEIGARITLREIARTDAQSIWRKRRRFNLGRVLDVNDPPGGRGAGGGGGGDLTCVEFLF